MTQPLHAATGGQEARGGPVAVLIHGAGGNRTVWASQARHLAARGTDVLAVDLPGHGCSPGKACDRVEDYVAAVRGELDRRELPQVALVGHSLGAMIALALAGRHPDRVTKLAMLGAGLRLTVNDALLTATADDPETAIAAIVDWGHSPSTHVGGGETPGLWMDGADLAILHAEAEAHPGSLHADFTASAGYDGAEDAAAVRCPTLVVAGDRDLMTPASMGREVAAAIAGAELEVLQGCGHFLMTERPAEVSLLLARFLTS